MSFLDFITGCFGGAASVVVGHPLDTVKVRLQTQEVGSKLYKGTWDCFSTILKQEKLAGLYKGVNAPLTTLTIINATIFGVHGSISKRFSDPNSASCHFAAGCAAGLAQSIFACPMERVKMLIQIQNDTAHAPRYNNATHAFQSLWKREGFKGMTRGYGITLIRDCPAFGIYFASYEWMIHKFNEKYGKVNTPQLLFAGGMAGSLSWIFTYPTDIIKSRFQTCSSYTTYRECIMQILREGGWRAMFTGLNSTLVRSFPANAATFFVVDFTYKRLRDLHLIERTPDMSTKHVMMCDLWHKNWFILPEAGSTSIDPMLRRRHYFTISHTTPQ